MTWSLDAGLGAAAVGLATGAFVPQVIAHLPEPAAVDQDVDERKRLYIEVAAHSGLRWRTAAAGAAAAALLGARIGWHPALLFGLYLVPVCVALAVVDWHTRYLPTRLIAPSYVIVAALVVLAWAITGDSTALVRSLVGSVANFAFFFVSTRAASGTATYDCPGCWASHWVGSDGRRWCWASSVAWCLLRSGGCCGWAGDNTSRSDRS